MQTIKIDRVRKQIKLDDKKLKGKVLGDINYPKFDKHISEFINIKGLTYVINNNIEANEEDEQVFIKSKVETDNELAQRYMKGQSASYKAEIEEIKKEFGL